MNTTTPTSRWLKSTEWLAAQAGKPNVVIVDASYYLPTQKRDPKAEYVAAHIPGAVFFDLNTIADTSTDLPHMLPGPDQFGAAVGALGIAETDTIVVYDATGLYSAPRVWWSFRIFGAKNAFILDGGFPAWKAEGRPAEAGAVKRAARKFNATMDTGAVAMVSDAQRAVRRHPRERTPGFARKNRKCLRQGRRRSGQADDHHLRLRRHRRGTRARPRRTRQGTPAHL
jgi:thiosulfate/3-mercaptopyruvate sulfurtransferase